MPLVARRAARPRPPPPAARGSGGRRRRRRRPGRDAGGRRARARAARRRRARTPRGGARRRPAARPARRRRARRASRRRRRPGPSESASPRATARPMRTPGEAARPDPDGERAEVARMRPALAQQRVDVLEQRLRARDPLAEHLAVGATRGGRRRARSSPPPSQCRTPASALCDPHTRPIARRQHAANGRAKRGGGSAPSPASGHSTNTIASSKYGSRSPHSAAEKPWKR